MDATSTPSTSASGFTTSPISSASPAATVPLPSTASAAPVAASVLPAASEPFLEQLQAPAVREDQVQNAVGFLSHPQVSGSTNTASKRSFLERKGLNAAEIDEAFRRVPEAPANPSAAAPATAAASAPAAQPVTYATQPGAQGRQSALIQQPYGTQGGQLFAVQPIAQAPVASQAAQGYRWSQIVLGVGVLAAAGWAVQQLVVPRLRAMVDSWQMARREAEEARNKELISAVESLKGCQEKLNVSTQALLEAVTLMREQQRAAAADGGLLTRGTAASRAPVMPADSYYASTNGRNSRYGAEQPYGAGGSNAPPMLASENYAALRAAAGYTNTYPPDTSLYNYSRDYNRDSGPATAGSTGGDGGRGAGAAVYGVPTHPYGAVRTAATGPYGGDAGQPQDSNPYKVAVPPSPAHSSHSLQSGRQQEQQQLGGRGYLGGPYGSSDRLNDPSLTGGAAGQDTGAASRTVPPSPPEQPAYPQSFHEVMEMVQQGITPSNVRTDINDTPPDPTRPLSEPRVQAPPKPWERAAAAGGSGGSAPYGGSPYGIPAAASRQSGVPSDWGSPHSDQRTPMVSASPSLPLPPTSYGMPVAAAGAAGGGAASNAGGSAGAVSNSGSGGGSTNLSTLPSANAPWRPPPPPVRTIVSSSPAPPPSGSTSGMASSSAPGAGGSDAAGSTYAHASDAGAGPTVGAPAVPPPLAAVPSGSPAVLTGPPSPPPSQPAFAASAAELAAPIHPAMLAPPATLMPDGPSSSQGLADPAPLRVTPTVADGVSEAAAGNDDPATPTAAAQ